MASKNKYQDLTGKKFFQLTVLGINEEKTEETRKKGKKRILWNCQCECGKIIQKDTYSLTHGLVKSCGHFKGDNLVGLRFGHWYVESIDLNRKRKNNNKNRYYNCICDCGNKGSVSGTKLKNGLSLSCGKCILNTYELINDEYYIGTDTKGETYIIDKDDYELVKQYSWSVNKNTGYIDAYDRKDEQHRKKVLMHRLIMQPPSDKEVDHINGDRTDNRKSNLRICTRSENHQNRFPVYEEGRQKVKGVYWDKHSNRWLARIGKDYKVYYLGSFKDFNDAVNARKEAEKRLFGDFSIYNRDSVIQDNIIKQKR